MKHNVDAKRWYMQKGNIIMIKYFGGTLLDIILEDTNNVIDGVSLEILSLIVVVVEQYYVM